MYNRKRDQDQDKNDAVAERRPLCQILSPVLVRSVRTSCKRRATPRAGAPQPFRPGSGSTAEGTACQLVRSNWHILGLGSRGGHNRGPVSTRTGPLPSAYAERETRASLHTPKSVDTSSRPYSERTYACRHFSVSTRAVLKPFLDTCYACRHFLARSAIFVSE
jgi:hypothetical protein